MDSTLDSNLKDHRTISRLRRVFHDKSTTALSNEFSLLANGAFKNLPGGLSESICDSKSLSLVDFKISVYKNIGTERFNVAEIKELFAYMDTNRNGRLERDEFIRGIRGSLNRSQQKLVNNLFYLLDKNSSGFIEEDELRCFFQEALLRDVVFGYTTPSVQSKEFVNLCGCKEKISLENFTEHYISKSLRFDDDSTFESEVMKEWHLRDEDFLFYPSQHLLPSGRSVSCARKLSLNSQQARLEKIDITDRNGESNGTVFLIRNRGRATSMPSIATEINSISRRQIVIDKIKKQISGVAMQENDPEDPFNAIAVVTNEEASLLPCIENEMKAASVRTIVPFQGVTKADCSYSSQNTVDEKSSESVMAALSDAMITINNEVKALQNISSYLESLISQHDTIIDNQSKLIDDFQTSLGWIKLL